MRHTEEIEVLYHPKAMKELNSFGIEIKEKIAAVLTELSEGCRLSLNKFKKISGTDLYEVRVRGSSGAYRALGILVGSEFWVLSAFHKKTQRLPRREIDVATRRFRLIDLD